MRHIYENAEEVVVFVGDGRHHRILRSTLNQPPSLSGLLNLDHGQILTNFLNQCRSFSAIRKRQFDSNSALNVFTMIRLLANPLIAEDLVEGLRTLEEPVRRQLFEYLRVFLVSPWWERIWVVQEVTVNKNVTIRYGPAFMSWDLLESAAATLSKLQRDPLRAQTKLESENWKVLLLLEIQVCRIRRIRQDWQLEGATDLGQLLHEFSSRHASDDRDKVFGLLSLATPGHGVIPDYNLNVGETFRNTALCLIKSSRSLDVWTGDQRRKNNQALPSWVPDWGAIFNSSDTRRLETLDIYNANHGWSIHISTEVANYWAAISRSLEQLLEWIEQTGRNRNIPALLEQPILKCCLQLRTSVVTHSEESYTCLMDIVEKLEKIASFCAPSDAESPFHYSKLFNTTYSGVVHPGWHRIWNPSLLCDLFAAPLLHSHDVFFTEASRVDQVARVGPQLWNWVDKESALWILYTWAYLYFEGSFPAHFDPKTSLGKDLYAGSSGTGKQWGGDQMMEFAQTIVAGVIASSDGRHFRRTIPADLNMLVHWLVIFIHDTEDVIEHIKQGQHVSPSQAGVLDSTIIPLQQFIQRATEGRVFFTTRRGLMGLGPASMKPGDTINVLPGGRTHFVLRHANPKDVKLQSELGKFWLSSMALIGDCYWNDEQWTRVQEHESTDKTDVSPDMIPLQGSLPFGLLAPFFRGSDFVDIDRVVVALI